MDRPYLLLVIILLRSLSAHGYAWGSNEDQGSYDNGGDSWSNSKWAGTFGSQKPWDGGTGSQNTYQGSSGSTGTQASAGGLGNTQQGSNNGGTDGQQRSVVDNTQQGSYGDWDSRNTGQGGGWNNVQQGFSGGGNQNGQVGSWNNVQQGTWEGNDGSHGTWGNNHVVSRDTYVADDGSRGWTERHYYTGTLSSNGGSHDSQMSTRDFWRQKISSWLQNGFQGFQDPWKTSLERGGYYVKVHQNDQEQDKDEKEDKHDFDYDRTSFYGPENWSFFWGHCVGVRQSPIDLRDSLTTYKDFSIKFSNLPILGFRGKFFNNGHAPTFTLLCEGSTVRGIPFVPDDKYKLIQFHFHFACDEEGGSEHKINGHRMDAEMHMVHYNTKYESFDKAMDEPDGLAVVAVFFQASSNTRGRFDKFMETNEKYILDVSSTGKETIFNPFLLMPKRKDAYVYSGSLTTPGCLESVNWVILRNPVAISTDTMKVFRKMHDGHGDEAITKNGNCRPIQPLSGRHIYSNFHSD